MSEAHVKNIVIIGGGSAGWLVAGILASRFASGGKDGLSITLIESGDVPTLGVGEGTWPSMRGTLRKIGITEQQFISACDASFKQGTKFVNWQLGKGEVYYHPFQLPAPYAEDFVNVLGPQFMGKTYAECICPQVSLDARCLAPKLITSDDYSHILNYGYHLNATKFGVMLREHAVDSLGVNHIVDTVKRVQSDDQGYIKSVLAESGREIEGDLFVDCSGFASVLMKRHYEIPFVSCRDYLFNDSAIAVQIPNGSDEPPIQSYTLSTAQTNGWIWDIGLTHRRGVGYTYSSAHTSAEQAQCELESYTSNITDNSADLTYRAIKFDPGYLRKFWHKNCVAIGVSSGFVEPLEASALVTVELAANMLAENLPATYAAMGQMERLFNERFTRHWEHIVEFLKLHYVLSERADSEYWIDNRREDTLPEKLMEKLELWKHFPPSRYDEIALQELFPTASYQYVLYGMGYKPPVAPAARRASFEGISQKLQEDWRRAVQIGRRLPTNRKLLDMMAGRDAASLKQN